MNRSQKRYFEDSSQKYTVGKISKELRQALRLDDDMLPIWIYRMRVLGYPPAWMQEAEMSTTLNLIENSSEQDRAKNPHLGSGEDGEIEDTTQYNKDSFIEFAGFNASLPKNVRDDWLILGMPPLMPKQQLSEAVKSMSFIEPVPYKKTKFDTSTTETIEDSPQSPITEQSSLTEPTDITVQSESLDSTNVPDQTTTSEDNNDDNQKQLKSDAEEIESKANESSTASETERKLKVISKGTPVPQSIQPRLPSLDKWAVGMGELIYFENLPTSTGAYKDKMKSVIDKIRHRHKDD